MGARFRGHLAAAGVAEGPLTPRLGSSDIGNVSFAVPTIHPMLAITDEPVPMHSEAFRELAATPHAQEVALIGATCLAQTTADLLGTRSLVASAWQEFRAKPDEPRRGRRAPGRADARHPGAPLRGDPGALRTGGRRRGPGRCRRPAERERAAGARRERCEPRAVCTRRGRRDADRGRAGPCSGGSASRSAGSSVRRRPPADLDYGSRPPEWARSATRRGWLSTSPP